MSLDSNDLRHLAAHVQERLDAYRDGELNPAQARRVEAHLAHCPACREMLEERRSLSVLLQDVPAAADLKPAGQFVAEVGLQLKRRAAPAARPTPAGRSLPWAWFAAPLALLFVLTFMQTTAALSSLLNFVPGAERYTQHSVQNLPIFSMLSHVSGSAILGRGADLLALVAPARTGWLTNLGILIVIGLLYASWLAGCWVYNQRFENTIKE